MTGQQRGAGLERRVAERHLEVDDDEEERAAEPGVDGEGHEVRPGELARSANSDGGSIGFGLRRSTTTKPPSRRRRRRWRAGGRAPTSRRRRRSGPPASGARPAAARPAPAASRWRGASASRLSGTARASHHDDGGEGHVEQEGPAPRGGVDQPAAEERPDRAGHAGEARPGADPAAARSSAWHRRREERQAAGHEQGAADALQGPGGDQRLGVGASPHSTEAAVNPARPATNTRRRP